MYESGINARPLSQPRRIISRSVIIELIFFVTLFARIAVAFRRLSLVADSLIGRGAIREVFLVRDDIGLIVEFQDSGPQMITELITDELCGRCIVAGGASFHQHNARLVIHPVQRLALQRDRGSVRCIFAADLKSAEIDSL
jgi:hypothetical protein